MTANALPEILVGLVALLIIMEIINIVARRRIRVNAKCPKCGHEEVLRISEILHLDDEHLHMCDKCCKIYKVY